MTIADILIAVAILACVVWGWRAGLGVASVAALELAACLAVAVVLHEWLAGLLHAGLVLAFGDAVAQAWSVLVAFAVLAWGPFAAIRAWGHGSDDDDDEAVDSLAERAGGAVAGLVGGVILVGGGLVTLSMVPLLSGITPSGDRLVLDAGKLVLVMAGRFAREGDEEAALPVWGEPASRSSNAAARLSSDPWFDADADGAFSDADRYRDVDANGTFSKDLYYEDLDGNGSRRIGLVDKYVVGRWDSELTSNERLRPDVTKPKPEPTPAPAPAPAAKPPAAKPGDPKQPAPKQPAPKPAGEKPVEDDF